MRRIIDEKAAVSWPPWRPKKTAVPEDPSRRDFLRAGVAAGLVAAARPAAAGPAAQAPSPAPALATTLLAAPPLERVRIGYVGVGRQGTVHLENLLQIEGVEIRAVCDIVPEKAAARGKVVAAKQQAPAGYSSGERDFGACAASGTWTSCTRPHHGVARAVLRAAMRTFTEVPAAVTVEECWLVRSQEKRGSTA
jgi:hypothetical protein